MEVIGDILNTYELASGQKINLEKTDVSFSWGVVDTRRRSLVGKLGVRLVTNHEKYLGVPAVVGRSKKALMKGLQEKLWKKLQGWKGMILSKPGREVLIKAVAQSIPTYVMSVFKLPSSFCNELDPLWPNSGGDRKEGSEKFTE